LPLDGSPCQVYRTVGVVVVWAIHVSGSLACF
jgi:hypothetical protein